MKNLSRTLLLSLILVFSACQKDLSKSKLEIDEELFASISECESPKLKDAPEKFVYFLKQWHLGPNADTTKRPATEFPQYTNQQAIFAQIIEWTHKETKAAIFMEGCEGVLDQSFKGRYNGHDLASLSKLSDEDLSLTLTHLGLKFLSYSLRHPGSLSISCGDDDELVAAHSLSFSDLRGYVGFLERLEHNKKTNPALYAKYADGARSVLKLEGDKSDVEAALSKKISEKVDLFERYVKERNDVFLSHIDQTAGPAIVILGGVHADDFKAKLEAKGIGCKILTPVGYPNSDDSGLLKELREKFNRHPKDS